LSDFVAFLKAFCQYSTPNPKVQYPYIVRFYLGMAIQLKINIVSNQNSYFIFVIFENIEERLIMSDLSNKLNYSYMLIGSLSHELYTPIHQLIGSCESLLLICNKIKVQEAQDNMSSSKTISKGSPQSKIKPSESSNNFTLGEPLVSKDRLAPKSNSPKRIVIGTGHLHRVSHISAGSQCQYEEIEQEAMLVSNLASGLGLFVQNSLDFANYMNNSLKIASQEFSLRDAATQLIKLFQIRIKRRKIKLEYSCADILMMSDKDKVIGLLFIFLENSVKYTFKGGISIKIKPGRSIEYVRFEVTDTGIGISEEDVQKLAAIMENPFADLRTKRAAGVGIGFRMARILLIHLSGREMAIQIRSEKNKGTSICYELLRKSKDIEDFPHSAVQTMTKIGQGDAVDSEKELDGFFKGSSYKQRLSVPESGSGLVPPTPVFATKHESSKILPSPKTVEILKRVPIPPQRLRVPSGHGLMEEGNSKDNISLSGTGQFYPEHTEKSLQQNNYSNGDRVMVLASHYDEVENQPMQATPGEQDICHFVPLKFRSPRFIPKPPAPLQRSSTLANHYKQQESNIPKGTLTFTNFDSRNSSPQNPVATEPKKKVGKLPITHCESMMPVATSGSIASPTHSSKFKRLITATVCTKNLSPRNANLSRSRLNITALKSQRESVVDFDLGSRRYVSPDILQEEDPLDRTEGSSDAPVALVVDDEVINADILQGQLENLGLKVYSVYDGELAVEQCVKFLTYNTKVDIVFMDYSMPTMNGDVCTRILRETRFEPVMGGAKIIGLTAHRDENVRQDCLKAGMDAVEYKPFFREDIRRTLATYGLLPSP
jgi:CheY-like chemotaxis protein/signal transduction histidine kinase